MQKRTTFMLDEDVMDKLRVIQAKMIQTTTSSMSFSKVINDVLRKGIKK